MHTETLAPKTRKVFDTLSKIKLPKEMYLSGGTGLALHLGHRESEDLDFFSKADFDPLVIIQLLEPHFLLSDVVTDKGTLNCFADGVKLQFLVYPYDLLEKPYVFEGIPISSISDIACTKLITISSRGSKKDFIDLYFILQKYTLEELFLLLKKKYQGVGFNTMHILKSLDYFDTAEFQPMPKMHKNITWEEVKTSLSKQIKKFPL